MSSFSLLLAHLLAAYAVLVEPLLGARMYQSLKRTVAQDDRALTRFYRLGIVVEWSWVFMVVLIVVSGGPALGELGLRWEAPPAEVLTFAAAIGLGALVGVLVMAVLMRVKGRRSGQPGMRQTMQERLEPVRALLPSTRKERRLFAALSITAGICEEIVYRGFLIFYLQEVFPGLTLAASVVVSSAIFGLVHLYQGAGGMLGTGAFGLGMAVLYVVSGSLIVSIVLHALLDLRILLIHRPGDPAEGGTEASA